MYHFALPLIKVVLCRDQRTHKLFGCRYQRNYLLNQLLDVCMHAAQERLKLIWNTVWLAIAHKEHTQVSKQRHAVWAWILCDVLLWIVLCNSKQASALALPSRSLILGSMSMIYSLIMIIHYDHRWYCSSQCTCVPAAFQNQWNANACACGTDACSVAICSAGRIYEVNNLQCELTCIQRSRTQSSELRSLVLPSSGQ